MKLIIKLLSFSLIIGASAHATEKRGEVKSVKSYFKTFKRRYKGPFGQNMMQMTDKRLTFRDWQTAGSPAYVFQAAFRRPEAQELARGPHGIYVGNLFSTNYYELKAEFLKGDPRAPYLTSEDSLEKLIETSKTNPLIFEKAKQMILNWNLEKIYILKNPSSALAKSFNIRGIAGVEYEVKYGKDFVNFYVTSMKSNLDMLPLLSLMKTSTLVSSNNLKTLRNKASEMLIKFDELGESAHLVNKEQFARLRSIKNAVHNNLTPEVLNMINRYMFETHASQGHQELHELKVMINAYFSQSIKGLNKLALKAKITPKGLKEIGGRRPKLSNLLFYANELVNVRNSLFKKQNTNLKYVEAAYLSGGTDYLYQVTKKHLSKIKITAQNISKISSLLLKILYVQGYVTEEESLITPPTTLDFDDYDDFVGVISDAMISNVKNIYNPYLERWKTVNKNVNYILDDSVRSSTLSLFDTVLEGLE